MLILMKNLHAIEIKLKKIVSKFHNINMIFSNNKKMINLTDTNNNLKDMIHMSLL